MKEFERDARSGGSVDVDSIVGAAVDVSGIAFSATVFESFDPKGLPDLADRVRGRLGDDSVVVLAGVADGRVDLVVASGPGAIAKGIKAGNVVRPAAEAVGGGGGGRDNMARAGGKEPSAVESAINAARAAG